MLQESKGKGKKSRKEPLKKKESAASNAKELATTRQLPTGLIVSEGNQVKSRRKKAISDDEGGGQADDELI